MLLFWFYFVARVCAIGLHTFPWSLQFGFTFAVVLCISLAIGFDWCVQVRLHACISFVCFNCELPDLSQSCSQWGLLSWREAEKGWAWCIKLDCANKMGRKGYTDKEDYVLQEASLYVYIVGIWTSRSLLTPSISCKITGYLWGDHADVVITVVQNVDKMESIENDDKMDLCVRVSFVMLCCELDTR